jgi:hypothetical protein
MRTVGILAWLAHDEVDVAAGEVDEARRQWSQHGFHIQHHYLLLAQSMIDLYRGEAARAYERVLERWPALEASLLLRTVQHSLGAAVWMRARCALAAFAQPGGKLAGDPRLLAAADRDGLRLEQERIPWMVALGRLVRAGVAACRREPAAAQLFEDAAARLDAADMRLIAQAARRRLGELTGARELVEACDQAMKQQTVVNPARMTRVWVPGFPT